MTFAQIDDLVGGLPPSARLLREWSGNDRSHVQAKAWLSINRLAGEVDLDRGFVRFD
jgi:hypothetical protein